MRHQKLILVAIIGAFDRYDNVTVAVLNTSKSTADGAVYDVPTNATPVLPPHAAPEGKDWMHTPDAECEWTLVDVYDDVPVYDKHTAQRIAPPDFGQPLAEHMTLTEPPHETGKVTYWDAKTDNWAQRIDYSGTQCWLTTDPRQSIVLSVDDLDIPDGYTTKPQPSSAHDWDAKKSTWVLNKAKQAELDAQAALQAGQARLTEIEQAIQSHINQTVAGLGMGFTDDQSLIGKYAGYDNVFRPIAESVGKWVAEIWYLAAQDKAAIIEGKKSIPTVSEAIARIPPFVLPSSEQS